MWDLVGNHEDRFSHNEAHMSSPLLNSFSRVRLGPNCMENLLFPPRKVFDLVHGGDHNYLFKVTAS